MPRWVCFMFAECARGDVFERKYFEQISSWVSRARFVCWLGKMWPLAYVTRDYFIKVPSQQSP